MDGETKQHHQQEPHAPQGTPKSIVPVNEGHDDQDEDEIEDVWKHVLSLCPSFSVIDR
jgi:hypothetical protein